MKIILALNTDHPSEEAIIKSLDLPYQKLIGCYKGQCEDSYMVEYKNLCDLYKIVALAQKHNQESILSIGDDLSCILKYIKLTQDDVSLGTWTQVPKAEAFNCDAWSLIDGQYYICK